MASLGPVMFRITERIYLGSVVAYEESASEGPGTFFGGAKVEGYLSKLSRGFYSTSAALSVLAGVVGINGSPNLAVQVNVELNTNFLLFRGIGYHGVIGDADTVIPLDRLSSVSCSFQVRVGYR